MKKPDKTFKVKNLSIKRIDDCYMRIIFELENGKKLIGDINQLCLQEEKENTFVN